MARDDKDSVGNLQSLFTGLKTEELKTVTIWKIPEGLEESGIEILCRRFGPVEHVKVLYENRNRGGKIERAFVTFSQELNTEAAINGIQSLFGMRAKAGMSAEERALKRELEEKLKEENIRGMKKLTEYKEKGGIGPMSFPTQELDGIPKLFQKIALEHCPDLMLLRNRPVKDEDFQSRQCFTRAEAAATVMAAGEVTAESASQEKQNFSKVFTFGSARVRDNLINGAACILCKSPARFVCGDCRNPCYCSRRCQVEHWSQEHALICGSLTAQDFRDEDLEDSFESLEYLPSKASFNCYLDQINEGNNFQLLPDKDDVSSCIEYFPAIVYDSESVSKIFNEMLTFYEENPCTRATDLSPGSVVVVRTDADVFRAFIVKVEGSVLHLVKIDHGSPEVVELKSVDIFELCPPFDNYPSSGVLVHLDSKVDNLSDLPEKIIDPDCFISLNMKRKFLDTSSKFVDAKCSLLDLQQEELVSNVRVAPWYTLNCVKEVLLPKESETLLPSQRETGDRLKHDELSEIPLPVIPIVRSEYIFLNFGRFSNEIFVAETSRDTDYQTVCRVLNSINKETLNGFPNIGDLIGVTIGKSYYRGLVVNPGQTCALIWLVDMAEEFSVTYDKMFILPDSVSDDVIPALATTIKLSGVKKIPVAEGGTLLKLSQLRPFLGLPLTVTEVGLDSKVTLMQSSRVSLNDDFEKVLAAGTPIAERVYHLDRCPVISFPVDTEKNQDAIFLHSNHPGLIFLCPADQIGLAANLMEQIQNYASAVGTNLSSAPSAGVVCLAQRSNGDDQWYRAVPLSYLDDKAQIFFPDFGFLEICPKTNFRSVHDVFMRTPFMAVRCALEDFTSDDDEMCKEFVSILPKFGARIQVRVLSRDDQTDLHIIRIPCLQKRMKKFDQ